jgi:hypothetical protein
MTDTTTQTTTATEPAKPVTLRDKLLQKYNTLFSKHADLTQELQDIASQINAIDLTASLAEGNQVQFVVGKKEEAKEVIGVIIGVKVDESGAKTFKVQYGSGFDTDVTVLPANKVKPFVQAEPA